MNISPMSISGRTIQKNRSKNHGVLQKPCRWGEDLGATFFQCSLNWLPGLVICYIAIENGHRNSGFTQLQNGDFP